MTNDAKPSYIPPHLQGKVDTFRNEPDGSISFRHDAAGNGEFGELGGRKVISREQYDNTFNRLHQLRNLPDSMKKMYGLEKYPTSFARQFNETVGGALGRGLDWGLSSQGKSTMTAGLLSALVGGVGGGLLARRAGDEHPIRKGLLLALLAGAAGTGVSAFMNDRNNRRDLALAKHAAVSDEAAFLRSAVLGESRLSASEKAEILRALAKMEDDDRDALADKSRKLFGFAAGMYIARVLVSKGLIAPIAGGIIGSALLSSGKGNKPKMNHWGQLSK